MLRKLVLTTAITGAFLVGGSAPASAAPETPVDGVPKSCQEWSQLLGISWFRNCDETPPTE